MNNIFLTREELVKLDQKTKMIPLTFDSMFKAVFTSKLDIFKEFLILETSLSLNPLETEIVVLNNELPKSKFKEYQKTIDILVNLNNKITINVELNNSNFNDYLSIRNELYASKLFSLMFEKGSKKNDFKEQKLIQLNLNTEDITLNYGDDIIIPYGLKTGKIYPQNKETILKYLAYYKKLYYNLGVKLEKAELWLVVILSESFTELYDLLENLLTEEERDSFIRKVIEMSSNKYILSDWELKTLNELEELARMEDATNRGLERGLSQGLSRGLEQGSEQTKRDIVINMHKKKISIEQISDLVNLPIEKVEEIINSNQD